NSVTSISQYLMILRRMIHFKCRNTKYPFSEVQRSLVTDDQVPWTFQFKNYQPVEYNSWVLKNKPWADPDVSASAFQPKWNELDGPVNRKSYEGEYVVENNRPLNPRGRTGITGRGVLGRWGPNHAADPIVTRWKTANGKKILHSKTNLPILQFCAIQRRDNNEWGIPGGMVDPGETVSETLKREFQEETLNGLEVNKRQMEKDKKMIAEFFKSGKEIYKGYVDDPRNTDNAWIETLAYNFHDDNGQSVGKFSLHAGDDAKNVKWMDIDQSLALRKPDAVKYLVHISQFFLKIVYTSCY
ncbi:hypothetical protein AMK59_7182, partial [Oryctes borbonicus]